MNRIRHDGAARSRGPQPRPLASLVIRTESGRLEHLKEAVLGALGQTYRPLEVVVVERRGGEAGPWLQSRTLFDQQYLVHVPLPDVGRNRAGNIGLKKCRGEFIGLLDDTHVLFDRHVAALAECLQRDPSTAAAYGISYEAPTLIEAEQPLRYRELQRYIVHRQPFSRELLQVRNFLPLPSVLFRRSLFEGCGGLDERLQTLEDWDLWRRFAAAGRFRMVDEITSLQRVPASARQAVEQYRQVMESRQLLSDLGAFQRSPDRPQVVELVPSAMTPLGSALRRTVASTSLLYGIYWHGRRLYYRWRQPG